MANVKSLGTNLSELSKSPLIPKNLTLENRLEEKDKLALQQDWAQLHDPKNTCQPLPSILPSHYVNAKNLACPMPLLKLKMALKTTAIGDSVYVTATDPNSQQDIGAFCQHLDYPLWTTTTDSDSATIFHLLITKNS